MKKYEVTLYYHTSVTVEVEAKDEKDAIENAYAEAGKSKYDQQFLNNVQEDGGPDVEEVE
jgi:hypothetical protein